MLVSGNHIRGSFGNCDMCDSYGNRDSYDKSCSSGLEGLVCQIAIC
tara:strand:+ start:1661 stop:1798 length:138 start_codon:yes stop_codon:yes gene_type:complete